MRSAKVIIQEYKHKKRIKALKAIIATIAIIALVLIPSTTRQKGIVTYTTEHYSEVLYLDGNIHMFKDSGMKKYDYVDSVFIAGIHVYTRVIDNGG